MAAIGFEGFEKRLELHFTGDEPMGLRRLDYAELKQVLDAVQCSVVSAVGNRHFDAYVLSESSLFVYPEKIIIKTCGTTQLLKSLPCLLTYASLLGLTLTKCRYTRGSFIFPAAQPFPHTSFADEVMYLEASLPPRLCCRKARVMPSALPSTSSHTWHVYTASADGGGGGDQGLSNSFTMEICMTKLDPIPARRFYRRRGDGISGEADGSAMTASTGIGDINPGGVICDYAFDPCGYSMNGIDGDRYSTIHVTPEDGYSYGSFECVGTAGSNDDIERLMTKVIDVFRPGTISVAISAAAASAAEELNSRVARAIDPLGLESFCGCSREEFPAAVSVVFDTFTLRRV